MKKYKFSYKILTALLAASMAFSMPLTALADENDLPDYEEMADARKLLPIQSNSVPGWPQGPEVSAQSAILIEANTGAILYAKNIDERLYPASTTKILTCTLAMENCDLDEMVTFSREAVNSVPWDGSKIGMDAGQALTMDQALDAILIGSANEVANAVAEHVGGSMDGFVDMMNARVKELGLTNTHFVNANGLYDDNHYTTAYDLAIIARDFFSYELLCKKARTPSVDFVPTDTQPDEFTINSKNMLLEGKKYEYEYLVGSKTGYTDKARQTLVSCAKKDGMELICVILMDESPRQFQDTVTLFDYGFNNFSIVNIGNNELSFSMDNPGFFDTGTDIFGESKQILMLNEDAFVILPNDATFNDLTMNVIYDTDNVNAVAKAEYKFDSVTVGYADILIYTQTTKVFDGSNAPTNIEDNPDEPVTNVNGKSIFVNLKYVFIGLISFVLLVTIVILVIRKIQFEKRKLKNKRAKKKASDKDRYYHSGRHHNYRIK